MRDLRRRGPELLRRARESGLRTSLDAQWDTEGEWMKVLAPSLPHVDYALMNEDEARMLTGEIDPRRAGDKLRKLGAGNVVIKLGARGCLVNGTAVAGYRVKAVDTTGAGDCFVGGFIAGLERGLTPVEAARVANALGALSVGQVGAIAGVVDWDSTRDWMSSAESD
jgi:sugar/nucleoside kinase (ribokinase family)